MLGLSSHGNSDEKCHITAILLEMTIVAETHSALSLYAVKPLTFPPLLHGLTLGKILTKMVLPPDTDCSFFDVTQIA